jgi:DNA polymerase-3 subunit delta'
MFRGGIDAARWSALPRSVVSGQSAVFRGWSLPLVLDALYKLCHDAMSVQASALPRYFAVESLPRGAHVMRLIEFMRTLNRVARHDEHPWNEALLVEALVTEAAASWEDDTKAEHGVGRMQRSSSTPLATLDR